MIQDIFPYRFNNQYRNEIPEKEDFLIVYKNGKILLCEEENLNLPKIKDTSSNSVLRYLFSIDDKKFFLLEDGEIDENGFQWKTSAELRKKEPKWLRFAIVTAMQISKWYDEHRICGRCGRKMEHAIKERAMICNHCGITRYPQICPAVIVAILKGDEILVSKYAENHSTYKKYALLAGFSEIGESIEDTVHREVMEEVGLKVKNLTFYKSQPWSFSDSLLMGFFCEVDGNDNIILDENELSFAGFVGPDELPESKDDISLTSEMLNKFKNGYRIY